VLREFLARFRTHQTQNPLNGQMLCEGINSEYFGCAALSNSRTQGNPQPRILGIIKQRGIGEISKQNTTKPNKLGSATNHSKYSFDFS
jgi:hypothetical protein